MVSTHLSRVFFGGNGPIHWGTTCAQAYAGVIFCGRVLTRAFAEGLLSRNAFANALVFSISWPHLPLHGHIFPFIGTSSPSLAHLTLHRHIFSFMDMWSPLSEKTPNQIHGALAYAKLPRRKPHRLIPDFLTQIAYAKIIVKLPQNAYARLREPVNTNVSASAGLT